MPEGGESAKGAQPQDFLRPCLLLLLKESLAHGYQLLDRLPAFGFAKDTGRLYRTLRAMEDEGLVGSWWQAENGHGRRLYEITAEGEAWLRKRALMLQESRRFLDEFIQRYETAEKSTANRLRPQEDVMATNGTGRIAPASQAGMLRFIHYGFMPNRLGYCGPDKNSALFQYGVAGEADPGLPPLLTKFLGPLPYLRTIASAAGIADIFDERVVEAYWIGNDLLEHVRARELYDTLKERFRKEVPSKVMEMVAGKVPEGARPHHSFHVFDVWRQVGRLEGNVLATMDNCRISWGTVKSVEGPTLMVDRRPLLIQDAKLALAVEAQPEKALRLLEGKGFVTDLKPGDLVSMHWGWICERITPGQARTLERYTLHHIRIANQTI